MFNFIQCYVLITVLILLFTGAIASVGDQTKVYSNCLYSCFSKLCSSKEEFVQKQPLYLYFLNWECLDECKYHCMWKSIKVYSKNGKPLPQFNGKWPFIRLFGIQEPASTLFSVLNGVSTYFMWRKFRSNVPKTNPFYKLWNYYGLLSLFAWSFSTLFHIRDIPFTEKLDYFSAFAVVLYTFFSLFVRSFKITRPRDLSILALPFISFYLYHIHYLTFVMFDYGYNMRANVTFGVINSIGWLIWCYTERQRKYIWKPAFTIFFVNILLLLELGDFPPWKYVLDAHALWHLGTIPAPLLWYSFLIQDCQEEELDLKIS